MRFPLFLTAVPVLLHAYVASSYDGRAGDRLPSQDTEVPASASGMLSALPVLHTDVPFFYHDRTVDPLVHHSQDTKIPASASGKAPSILAFHFESVSQAIGVINSSRSSISDIAPTQPRLSFFPLVTPIFDVIFVRVPRDCLILRLTLCFLRLILSSLMSVYLVPQCPVALRCRMIAFRFYRRVMRAHDFVALFEELHRSLRPVTVSAMASFSFCCVVFVVHHYFLL